MSVNQVLDKLTERIGSDVVNYLVKPMLTPTKEQLEKEFNRIMIETNGKIYYYKKNMLNHYSTIRKNGRYDLKEGWPSSTDCNDYEDVMLYAKFFFNELQTCNYLTSNIKDSFNNPIISYLSISFEKVLTIHTSYDLFKEYLEEKETLKRYIFTKGYDSYMENLTWKDYEHAEQEAKLKNMKEQTGNRNINDYAREFFRMGLNEGETVKDVLQGAQSNRYRRRTRLGKNF